MFTTIIYYLTLILFLLLHVEPAWSNEYLVANVIDGDTISIWQNNKRVKVRLYGVDAPEKGQAYGRKAKQATNRMIRNKKVSINIYDTDRYGRLVATVHAGRTNINEKLIRDGWAWLSTKYCKESFCKSWKILESRAQMKKKGLWVDPYAMPPWTFRREEKRSARSSKRYFPEDKEVLLRNVKNKVLAKFRLEFGRP